MICKNCNAQIPDGAAFCTECGAKIESAVTPEINAPYIYDGGGRSALQAVKDRKKRKGGAFVLVLGIASVMAVLNPLLGHPVAGLITAAVALLLSTITILLAVRSKKRCGTFKKVVKAGMILSIIGAALAVLIIIAYIADRVSGV